MTGDETKDLIILERMINHQYDLDKYSTKQLTKIQSSVEQAKREVTEYMNRDFKRVPTWSVDRSKKVLSEMDRLTYGVRSKMNSDISETATQAAVRSQKAYNDIVSFDGRVKGFNTVALSSSQLRSQVVETKVGGKMLGDWVNSTFSKRTQSDISREILTGRLKGDSYKKLVKRVRQGFDNIKNFDATALTRTYVQEANVNALQNVYAANRDIIKGVKWSATMEMGYSKSGRGTCAKCASLDGNVYLYPKDKEAPKQRKNVRLKTKPHPNSAEVQIQRESVAVDALKQNLQNAEAGIRNNNYETGIVFDSKGNELWRKVGEEHQVAFSDSDVKFFQENPGVIFTHNHPNGGPFSLPDVRTLINFDMSEIRAVGNSKAEMFHGNYAYSMKYDPKSVENFKWGENNLVGASKKEALDVYLRDSYNAIDRELYTEINPKVMSGEMSIKDANTEHGISIWKRMVSKLWDQGIDISFKQIPLEPR